jgi:phage-related protein (TIGR01555 family)
MTSARPWLQTRLDSLLNTTGQEVGFYNSATGMGTSRDKTSYTTYGTYQTLDTQTLAGLYHGHDLSARVVDVIPDEELRLPFRVEVELESDEDGEEEPETEENKKEAKRLAKLIKREFKRLGVREHLLLGRKWGRCFGGAATILGAQDGRAARQPLDPRQVRQIDWLRTVDRRYLWPNTYYTSGAKNGQPETYYLNDHHPGGSESFVIHESRLILWPGATTAQKEKDLNRSWDHSVLDRLWGVLKSFETLYKGVELLITEGPQAVYKVRDLVEQIAAGQEQAVMTRLEVIETMRSIFRAVVIDANGGEDFQRQQVTYSGTPEILGQIQLRLSAATQIPMIILFGQAPGGLGVTGENDLRWFFDRTASSQLNVLGPRIEQLADLVLQVAGYDSAVGQCEVKFAKLWTPTAKEEAEARFITSQTDNGYVQSGVISPEEVGLSRFGECGEWHPDWKAYDRAARIKVLRDVLANLEAGSEPGAPGQPNATTDPTSSNPGSPKTEGQKETAETDPPEPS